MQCPKCGSEQPETSIECMACGIIFAKYQAKTGAPSPRAAKARPPKPASKREKATSVKRLSVEQSRDFCLSISQLCAAEESLLTALSMLEDSATPRLRAALTHMQLELAQHGSAARACKNVFPEQVTDIISVYEKLGFASVGFETAALVLDNRGKFRMELLRRLSYPLLLLIMAGIMTPLSQLVTGSVNDYLSTAGTNLLLVGGFIAALFWGIPYVLKQSSLGARLEKAAWTSPWPATIYVNHMRVLLCRVTAHNIRALMPLAAAMHAAAQVTAQAHPIEQAKRCLQESENANAKQLAQIGIVSDDDLMLAVSSAKSGALPQALDTLAERYLESHQQGLKWLFRVVTGVFMTIVIVIVTMTIIKTVTNVVGTAGEIPSIDTIRQW